MSFSVEERNWGKICTHSLQIHTQRNFKTVQSLQDAVFRQIII